MATSNFHRVEDQINDLTECSICTEIMSEPKVIPCLHTFCLKCLEKFCAGNEPGKSMPCPLCRIEFEIPEGGLSKLKTNFFVEKLIEAGKCLKTLSPSKSDRCNCPSGQDLVIYCQDCQVAACYRCKLNNHKGHNSTDYEVYCSQHCTQQILDDVSKVKSMMTDITSRSIEFDGDIQKLVNNFNHTKYKIEARSEYLRQQIDEQTQMLLNELEMLEFAELEKVEKIKKQYVTLTKQFENFLQSFEGLTDEVSQNDSSNRIQLAKDMHLQYAELVDRFQCVESGKKKYFLEISFEESDINCEVGTIFNQRQKEDDIEDDKHSLTQFSEPTSREPLPQSCEPLTTSCEPLSTSCEPLQASCESQPTSCEPLTTSCEPLQASCEPPTPSNSQPHLQQGTGVDQQTGSGNISRDVAPLAVSFGEVLRLDGQRVTGLVVLGTNLYVTFWQFSKIKVYDCSNLEHVRSLFVKPLNNPYDITGVGSLLYISERDNMVIYKFRLAEFGRRRTSKWEAADVSLALSMTSEQNVLATSCAKGGIRFIAEYSRHGDLVRRIDLQWDCLNPWHAICLSNGNLVVSHGEYRDRLRRVCLIDSAGNVIKSFGGRWSTAVGHLNEPIRLVSHKGFILIADSRNNNVQVLNKNLEFRGEIISCGCGIHTMTLDEMSNELFIADYNDRDSNIMKYRLTP